MNDKLSHRVAGLSAAKQELLKQRLQGKIGGSRGKTTVPKRPADAPPPLSFGQERLWFLEQMDPGNPVYNEAEAFRIKGSLRINVLEECLNEIVHRHEVLRSAVDSEDGQPFQVIHEHQPIALRIMDLSMFARDRREAEATRLMIAEARKPFSMANGPMFRAYLYRLEETEFVLLLMMHHIVSDEWSFNIFMKELGGLYDTFSQGRPSPLTDLPIQYADFACWQRSPSVVEELQKQFSYWKQQLAGSIPIIQMPADHPRPPAQTSNGAFIPFSISGELIRGLRDISRKQKGTLFMTLLAAFKTLVYRYTGQVDIVIGSPISNRRTVEIEALIGFLINMLPLRSRISHDMSFLELLSQVVQVSRDAYENQDLPFDKLVEQLSPERNLSYSPLFQIMFIYQNAPHSPLKLGDLAVSHLPLDIGIARYDLTLYMWECVDGLAGKVEYNTDLFKPETIARMIGHFETLLQGVVIDPNQRLWKLPIMNDEERHLLLVEWNDTKADFNRDSCVHELFESQVRRTPKAIAAQFEDQHLSYTELDVRSSHTASYLRSLGIGPDELVGVYMDSSLEMVVGLLGILKAGGAYLPLDTKFPRERLAFMINDAKPRVLVTLRRLLNEVPSRDLTCNPKVICIEDLPEKAPAQIAFEGPTSSNLAYVIYTSGSTGNPKGVEISHRALVNLLISMSRKPGISPHDTLLSVTTISFDIFGLEIWLPLITGAKLVLVPQELVKDGRKLADAIANYRVTVMQATPATWRMLLETGWEGNPSLKIFCGGEAWSQALSEPLLQKCASLWNMYGPTETTIWSACSQVRANEPVLIGGPISNTQFYVVDAHLQPLPPGVPGELLVGGDGLARGYLNLPELTAEKFIPDPFGADEASRLYRTGDLVRYHACRQIEFIARLDHQVKVRGFRIELGEIESVLSARAEVKQVVVVAREDGAEKQLVAYIVPSKGQKPTPDDLRGYLKSKLPDYMIPAAFVMLEEFPLTPNGKVNRNALPAPGGVRQTEKTYIAPQSDIERRIAQIWRDLLRVDRVGIDDNFFDLGGHSLLAVRLFARVEKAFGRSLPLAILFQAPTVRRLAALLNEKDYEASWSSLVAMNTTGSKSPLFLMHSHGGNVLEYEPLARHLGKGRPIFALQARGLDGSRVDKLSLEDMATLYLDEIRSVQAHGPYYLGGFCFGGLLAMEAAQQLLAANERVSLLLMINSSNKGYPRYSPAAARIRRLYTLAYRIAIEADRMHGKSLSKALEHLQIRGRRIGDLTTARVEVLFDSLLAGWKNPLRTHSKTYYLQRLAKTHELAWQEYDPKPYPGSVLLVRAKRQPIGICPDPLLGWERILTGDVRVEEAPGYQQTMLDEPNVQRLAALIACSLDHLDGDSNGS